MQVTDIFAVRINRIVSFSLQKLTSFYHCCFALKLRLKNNRQAMRPIWQNQDAVLLQKVAEACTRIVLNYPQHLYKVCAKANLRTATHRRWRVRRLYGSGK